LVFEIRISIILKIGNEKKLNVMQVREFFYGGQVILKRVLPQLTSVSFSASE
jgi:hypothetical protein